ncbi:nicotinate phosphoribosyltransferase, partial [Streptomyces sp. NPDC086147]
MRGGLRTEPPDTLAAARERFARDLAALPEEARRIEHPVPPRPTTSARLAALTSTVRHRIETRTGGAGTSTAPTPTQGDPARE